MLGWRVHLKMTALDVSGAKLRKDFDNKKDYPLFSLISFGFLDIFLYLCRVKERWFWPRDNPSNSPFKTCKVMSKTVRKILQVISYIITLLLGGAAGGAIAQ